MMRFDESDRQMLIEVGAPEYMDFQQEDLEFASEVCYQAMSVKKLMKKVFARLKLPEGRANYRKAMILSQARGPRFSSYKKITPAGEAAVKSIVAFWGLVEVANGADDLTLSRLALLFPFAAAAARIFLRKHDLLPMDPAVNDALPYYLAFTGAVIMLVVGSAVDTAHILWTKSRTNSLRSNGTEKNKAFMEKSEEEKARIAANFRTLARSQIIYPVAKITEWVQKLAKMEAESSTLEEKASDVLELYSAVYPDFNLEEIGMDTAKFDSADANELLKDLSKLGTVLSSLNSAIATEKGEEEKRYLIMFRNRKVQEANELRTTLEAMFQYASDVMETKENDDSYDDVRVRCVEMGNKTPKAVEDFKKQSALSKGSLSAESNAGLINAKIHTIVTNNFEEDKREALSKRDFQVGKNGAVYLRPFEKMKNPKQNKKKSEHKEAEINELLSKMVSEEKMDQDEKFDILYNKKLVFEHFKNNKDILSMSSVRYAINTAKKSGEHKLVLPEPWSKPENYLSDEALSTLLSAGKHFY